jgi:hypothetical protein
METQGADLFRNKTGRNRSDLETIGEYLSQVNGMVIFSSGEMNSPNTGCTKQLLIS